MEERVLNLLEEICEDDIVREDRNLNLFEEGVSGFYRTSRR